MSTAAARPSDTGAGTRRLTAGCAAVSHHKPPSPSPTRPWRSGNPHSTRRANTHLWRPRLLSETAHRQGNGQGRAGLRARTEGPEQPQPPSSQLTVPAGSDRRQPPGRLQLTKNLKANPPGSLPVPGVNSATPAHAGRRPGSEDAGRRARAGRGVGGADGSRGLEGRGARAHSEFPPRQGPGRD